MKSDGTEETLKVVLNICSKNVDGECYNNACDVKVIVLIKVLSITTSLEALSRVNKPFLNCFSV
jgi:hypothetical protein